MTLNAQQTKVWRAAQSYLNDGFAVIPCYPNKKPIGKWRYHIDNGTSIYQLRRWFEHAQFPSIGLIGGSISNNVVFIDLDGIPAVQRFAAAFPSLCENTKSVLTGSQEGVHLYVRVNEIPDNINVRVRGVGGFEIRGNRQYVIAPPSPHPSGNEYRVYRDKPILHRANINDVYEWMLAIRDNHDLSNAAIDRVARPQNVRVHGDKTAYVNKVISQEIAKVEIALKGTQNSTLYRSALKLASLSAGGYVTWSEIVARLIGATALPYGEAIRTIESAHRTGSQNPRVIS